MNQLNGKMIWDFEDVKENHNLWNFNPEDFVSIFVENAGKKFYNQLLNELIHEVYANVPPPPDDWVTTYSITPEELEAYDDWCRNPNQRFSAKEVWDLLLSEDKEEIFGNDFSSFEDWYLDIPDNELDYYIDRVTSGLSILTINKPKQDTKTHFVDEGAISAFMINGKLALTSSDLEVLEKIKVIFNSKGNQCIEHRLKKVEGVTYHTYLFDLTI